MAKKDKYYDLKETTVEIFTAVSEYASYKPSIKIIIIIEYITLWCVVTVHRSPHRLNNNLYYCYYCYVYCYTAANDPHRPLYKRTIYYSLLHRNGYTNAALDFPRVRLQPSPPSLPGNFQFTFFRNWNLLWWISLFIFSYINIFIYRHTKKIQYIIYLYKFLL